MRRDSKEQSPQDFGMHLIRSHRCTDVQAAQVLMNLIFIYSGKDFAAQAPILLSSHPSGGETEVAIEDWNKKFLSSSSNSTSFLALFIKRWHLFLLPFPGYQTWRTSCYSLCLSRFFPAFSSSVLPYTTKCQPQTLPRPLSIFPLPVHLFLPLWSQQQGPSQTKFNKLYFFSTKVQQKADCKNLGRDSNLSAI